MSARLHIDGEVLTPQDLDFEALRALSEQLIEPSSLLGGREIAAVRLDTLLALAGLGKTSRSIVAESEDGTFRTSISLETAGDCVIVYRVGDSALPGALGGPFRLVTGGRSHCGDVKAVGALHVFDRAHVEDAARVCNKRRLAV